MPHNLTSADLPDALSPEVLDPIIDAAIAEDVGNGDITCKAVIPDDLRFAGMMKAREDIVVAGLPIAERIIKKLAPDATVTLKAKDGDKVSPGTVLMEMEGPAAGLLTAERTALNMVQHLSGIATLVDTYVGCIKGTNATLLDTRKTIPGLRRLAKYAVTMGGGTNHRMRLDDGVLIKDNHIAICGGITQAVQRCKDMDLPNIEVECDTLDQVKEAAEAGADIVLLDNMPPDVLREAIAIVDGRCKTEASGGVHLMSIGPIAQTGVDYISVGAITQSAPAIDIGLDWKAI